VCAKIDSFWGDRPHRPHGVGAYGGASRGPMLNRVQSLQCRIFDLKIEFWWILRQKWKLKCVAYLWEVGP